MSSPFLAEIRMFPFNFAPTGWALCNGQLLPISQNTALFSLLGTTYGGDGKSTFALPNLQGQAPMHPGQGPGLSQHFLGETSGSDMVTLLTSEMPVHTHSLRAVAEAGEKNDPADAALGVTIGNTLYNQGPAPPLTNMAFQAVAPAGGSLPHNNLQPYLTVNFCIAMQGIFPQRP